MPTETFNPPVTTYFRDVKIGDVIRLDFMTPSPFNVCVVRNIDSKYVYLYRSYIHTSEISYSSGVICYQGHEDIIVDRNNTSMNISLLERRNPA